MNVKFSTASVIAIAAATLFTSSVALAAPDRATDDSASAVASETPSGEIVVTANRRAENLQKTSLAIDVI